MTKYVFKAKTKDGNCLLKFNCHFNNIFKQLKEGEVIEFVGVEVDSPHYFFLDTGELKIKKWEFKHDEARFKLQKGYSYAPSFREIEKLQKELIEDFKKKEKIKIDFIIKNVENRIGKKYNKDGEIVPIF
jgi:hypothetical protein